MEEKFYLKKKKDFCGQLVLYVQKSDLCNGISKFLLVTLESCSKLENVSGAEDPDYIVMVQLLLVYCLVQKLSL